MESGFKLGQSKSIINILKCLSKLLKQILIFTRVTDDLPGV